MKLPRGLVLAVVLAASTWNLALVVGAVFNAHWVLTRVAGGQLHSLSSGLRIVYLGYVVLTAWVILFAIRLWKSRGAKTRGDMRWARLVVILYAGSTIINLFSRSVDENWNAIAAAAVAAGFAFLRKPA